MATDAPRTSTKPRWDDDLRLKIVMAGLAVLGIVMIIDGLGAGQ